MDTYYDSLFSALALVLVIEGILPFVSPELWRRTMRSLLEKSDKIVRLSGFVSMVIGVIVVTLLHIDW